jgi:flagellar hook protein FlgE
MYNTFSTALSALKANSVAIDVIGNNLANLNTTGYKSTVASFHDLVTQSLDTDGSAGSGVSRTSVTRQFTQGAIQSSSGSLDAAIEGNGFFVVKDTDGRTLYTRAGNFQLDAKGNLLTATGQKVQGWNAVNGTVSSSGAVSDITVPVGAVRAPAATRAMTLDLNLDAATAVNGTFSTPIQVIDSLGASHTLTATFTKTSANNWSYVVTIPSSDLASSSGSTAGQVAHGNLTFTNGLLTSPASTAAPVSVSVTGLADGAADMTIDWSLFTSGGSPRITQYSQSSAASASSQDGVAAGLISSVSMSDGGEIVAHYSNGEDSVVGRLAVASIRNPETLVAVGENNLAAGVDTATPSVGEGDTGGRGKIVGGALESSTVDIATEFTSLIVMQRSYQANARVITASDEISQETINLIR